MQLPASSEYLNIQDITKIFSCESRLILYEIFWIEMKKKLLTIFFLMGLIAPAAYADYDDYSTPGINEGAWGSSF